MSSRKNSWNKMVTRMLEVKLIFISVAYDIFTFCWRANNFVASQVYLCLLLLLDAENFQNDPVKSSKYTHFGDVILFRRFM